MAEITWIKLRTNMFDDEKIKLIEALPDGDMVIVVWMKLLAQAGKVNCGGYIMITENIPMTMDEMVIIFRKSKEHIIYALQALRKFGMIEIDEDSRVFISNWEKHQNIDGMEKIREQNRIRKQRERERKKLLSLENSHVTITGHHAIDIEKEKEKDIYKESDLNSNSDNYSEEIKKVISKYKELENLPRFNKVTPSRKKAINARLREEGIDKVIAVLEGLNNDEYYVNANREGANWYNFDYPFKPTKFNMLVERFEKKSYSNNTTNQTKTVNQYKEISIESLYGDA